MHLDNDDVVEVTSSLTLVCSCSGGDVTRALWLGSPFAISLPLPCRLRFDITGCHSQPSEFRIGVLPGFCICECTWAERCRFGAPGCLLARDLES